MAELSSIITLYVFTVSAWSTVPATIPHRATHFAKPDLCTGFVVTIAAFSQCVCECVCERERVAEEEEGCTREGVSASQHTLGLLKLGSDKLLEYVACG